MTANAIRQHDVGTFQGRVASRLWCIQLERPGFAWKLISGVLLVGMLPLLITAVVVPATMKSAFAEVARDYLTQVTQHLALNVQTEMRRHVDAVEAVSKIDSLRSTILDRNRSRLASDGIEVANLQLASLVKSSSSEHQGLFLCGKDGVVFAGSLRNGDSRAYAHIDILGRRYFTQARETLKTVVSDPLRSLVDNSPIVVIAVPIVGPEGEFEGLVGLGVEMRHLVAFITSHASRQVGAPFAVDRNGVVFAHQDPARMFGAPLAETAGSEALATRMLRGEVGVEAHRSPDREEKLTAFAPVTVAGWSIGASLLMSEFDAAARGIQSVIAVLAVAFALVALLGAGMLAIGIEQIRGALTEVRTSNDRFNLFSAAAGDVIWDCQVASRKLWVNRGPGTFLPETVPADATLDDLIACLPEAERGIFEQGFRSCRDTGSWTGEHHVLRQDGTLGYAIHRILAIRGSAGTPERMVGRLTDISDRRAAEEKLAQQAALLDQTRDGILVLGLDHTIRYWNRGAQIIYGWTEAEAVGRKHHELLATETGLPAELVLQKGEWQGTLNKRTKAGVVLTLDCRWTLLCDEKGRPQSILTLDSDITERKQMEAKFLRAQRLESIGTLAGGIAHDFNNLLSPILIGVEVLKRTTQGTEAKKIIGMIEESSLRAASLVKQILSFARGEEGARVSVLLSYVVREVEAIALRTFPRNIAVRLNVEKDLWLVHADPTQMNQILMNLCVNARDAMPAGGRLTLSVRNIVVDETMVETNRGAALGPHVVIEISDTGTGISPTNLERIFEPFFTTKELGKGTGLGLSTVIGIVRSHGGFVNVYSEEGNGSVFRVYLPASGVKVAAVEGPASSRLPDLGHGELVLLVDDDAAALGVTRHVLEVSGYRVITATDGANALSIYHSHRARISVVVTDMMMPVMDGPALVLAIRRIDPNMCFVGVSGLGDNHNQIKAEELAMKHFLCKPFTTAALLATLRASLADRVTFPHRALESPLAMSDPVPTPANPI
ncbi:MAG: ATP-binding protein [Opitutaceae bacterium]